MKWRYAYPTAVLLVLLALSYFIVRLNVSTHFIEMWNSVKNSQGEKGEISGVKSITKDVLVEMLRQKHHLRPLTELEEGKNIQELPNGVYGFSLCNDVLDAKDRDQLSLEIQKRVDGIIYYVGYASEEDIEKYLARQKNFHILTFPRSTEKAVTLFEIPVYFVSKCERRSFNNGYVFDLFVKDIPELQS